MIKHLCKENSKTQTSKTYKCQSVTLDCSRYRFGKSLFPHCCWFNGFPNMRHQILCAGSGKRMALVKLGDCRLGLV